MSATVAIRQPLWSPLDEGRHWETADTLSRGHWPFINRPFPPLPADLPQIDTTADFQAAEPPLGYLPLLAARWLGQAAAAGLGPLLGRTFNRDYAGARAMRLFNSFVLALLVPALWLCSKTVVRDHLAASLGVPGAAFLFRGPLMDATRISNDALVTLLVTLALYAYLRRRERVTPWLGILFGALVAVATLVKYQAVYAFLVVGLLLAARSLAGGLAELRRAVFFGAPALVAWALIVTPWFAFVDQRYGSPTASDVERSVLPQAAQLPSNPWPDIFGSGLHVYLSGTLGEVFNPLHFHFAAFNWAIAELTPVLIVAGALVVLLPSSAVGSGRLERLALLLSAAGIFALLSAISISAGLIVMWSARNYLPAIFPVTLLVAAPLLLLPVRLHGYAATAVVAAVSALALFTISLWMLPWPVVPQ